MAPWGGIVQNRSVRLVLASASPRRQALLAACGFDLDVDAADVDEAVVDDEAPADLVLRLARAKASAVAQRHPPDAIVVAADTTVALDRAILNKPVDDADARRMLRLLSGQTHSVLTGYCVRRGDVITDGVVVTAVAFRALRDVDVDAYLRTGEHRDKAGAYGIQGAAAVLVSSVAGSLTNVIGLPVDEVVAAIDVVAGAAHAGRT